MLERITVWECDSNRLFWNGSSSGIVDTIPNNNDSQGYLNK